MRSERIDVSAEMLALIGPGQVVADWPAHWSLLSFTGFTGGGPAMLTTDAVAAGAELLFAVDPAACERLFGAPPDPGSWRPRTRRARCRRATRGASSPRGG